MEFKELSTQAQIRHGNKLKLHTGSLMSEVALKGELCLDKTYYNILWCYYGPV